MVELAPIDWISFLNRLVDVAPQHMKTVVIADIEERTIICLRVYL